MRRVIALMAVFLAMPAQAADRTGARERERGAAYQTIERQPVTERYRYYVPTSVFAQGRRDEARAHAKWRPQPNTPNTPPAW
jgi:poly(3-hydroxybutyrate) depolymerase